jgi:prolyl-tRNA editing enzyme YbaK/EbsC (Cys-tRNA(Pro) deacylase)
VKPIQALHEFLQIHFPNVLRSEVLCTCGAGNHVRIVFFRVNHLPAAVVLPEGADLSAEALSQAVAGADVEPLPVDDLDNTYVDSELGRPLPFENPFGGAVYMDESLLHWKELVFCPRMFSGQRGECFRAPTKDFLDLTRAITLPLVTVPVPQSDAWAV